MMNHLLFVCTGNYYRSRTAEEYFNYLASQHKLDWKADSRGLREDMSKSSNVGPMSPYAIEYLEHLKVPIVKREVMPKSLLAEEADNYHLIICMDEKEHVPMIDERFPQLKEVVTYWQVRDVQFESPVTALELLRKKVESLVRELEITK